MGLQILLLLLLIGPSLIWGQCSVKIISLCKCSQSFQGLKVHCSFSNFSEIVEALSSTNRLPLRQLKIDNTQLPRLTSNALNQLEIRELDLSGIGLNEIAEDGLRYQAPDLEQLILANNSFSKIPLLKDMTKLKSLDLSGNDIESVPESTFKETPLLEHLRLERNKICNLQRASLEELKGSLTLLDISKNCLQFVPAQNIRGSSKLAWLDLSSNQIVDLPNLQFVNMPELSEVYLDNNRIGQISPLAFMNSGNVRRLSLKGNRISIIGQNEFQSFQNIEVLDLRNNMIKALVPSAIHDLPKLKMIYLDENGLEKVETLAFGNNPNLQTISLQNNKISELFRNAFDQLPGVTTLLLNNNSLPSIGEGMFAGMINLQRLNLQNNMISQVHPSSFDLLPQLTTLDLSSNLLSTLPKNVFADQDKLFWVDISNNKISGFQPGAFSQKVSNILLDGNPIECDDDLTWFVEYLVKYNVRTFLPKQKEVVCAGPLKYKGTRLKDLMIKKANESIFNSLGSVFDPKMLTNPLVSGLLQGSGGSIPLTNILPTLDRNLGGFSSIANIPLKEPISPGFVGGLSKFTTPIARMVTGDSNGNFAGDVKNLLSELPGFVTQIPRGSAAAGGAGVGGASDALSVPGFPGINLNNIPPAVIQHVLKGNQIPGVPPHIMQRVVKQYMSQLGASGQKAPATGSFGASPSLTTDAAQTADSLPDEIKKHVLRGGKIPGLSDAQLEELRSHYAQQLESSGTDANKIITGETGNSPSTGFNLPPGLDLTNLSPQLLEALASGQIPDFQKHPEILQLIQDNPSLVAFLEQSKKTTKPEDELGQEIPNGFIASRNIEDREYIDLLGKNSNAQGPKASTKRNALWITCLCLGILALLTVLTLFGLCYQRRRRRRIQAYAEKDCLYVPAPSPKASQDSLNNLTSDSLPSADGTLSRAGSAVPILHMNQQMDYYRPSWGPYGAGPPFSPGTPSPENVELYEKSLL